MTRIRKARASLSRLAFFALSIQCLLPGTAWSAGLLAAWRADDINLNNGDAVTTWSSDSNLSANAMLGQQPTFRLNATPAGTASVDFNGSHLMTSPSPVGGRTAFSLAIVFKADAAGANNNGQWWGKTGLVDAEQPGVTSDWGTVLTEAGQVGIGTGNGDNSTYSTGASVVDGNFHVAVFGWGGGSQTVYLDDRAPVTQSGVSTLARNNAGIAFGGILTGEANRRLNGELVEMRFYDAALNGTEAAAVIQELEDIHILGNLPRIVSFTATPEQIYLGDSASLAWEVNNATTVTIDHSVGTVAAQGSRQVSPTALTTYTLTASNGQGTRQSTATVMVDPGIPSALNFATNTARNTAVAITLRGTDPNGGTLSYAIVDDPAHGALSGSPPNVTYAPDLNFAGMDSFTFRVSDGMFDSDPATVSIEVIPPPTAPEGITLSSTNIPAGIGPGAFVATIQAADINNPQGDSHTFELVNEFGDNAQFTIVDNVLATGPSFNGAIGATFDIRIRATDSTALSFEQTLGLTVVDVPRTVVINEMHYNSDDNTVLEEFIELYNPTANFVDISQWRVRGGVDYFFPANVQIPPFGFVVVAEDPATIQSRYGVTAFGPWDGGLSNEGEEITLRDALNEEIDVVDFNSAFPWPIAANGEGSSMELVNPSLDNDLGGSWRSSVATVLPVLSPTPGQTNSVWAPNFAPQIRQVDHAPQQPASSDQVVVTAKITDPEGVDSVELAYQVVAPGQFLPAFLPLTTSQLNSLNANPDLQNPPNPAFEDPANWTTAVMNDNGMNGDEVAGDAVYSVTLPPRAHRTLVRYRITSTDSLGLARRAPFEDDPSLNFAYFVNDGIPDYLGFSSESLQTLPVYTLITRDSDLNHCTAWFNTADQLPQGIGGQRNEGRLHFNWEGAIVYDGEVYDHIIYRLRGANGRYHPGKRNFRFRFNSGKYLDAKNQYGEPFPTQWRELSTGKGHSNRGTESFALNEVVNFFLWNKVGVPAPLTFHFHFRVIRGAGEQGANQYSGDFWGLNWGQEKYDVNFLEAHDLPRGNLYKLVDNYVLGTDEQRYQAAFAPTQAEDFYNIENNLSGSQSIDWLLAHANYTNWYRYFTIAEAIRHYDTWPSANKNGAWYFEPSYTPANGFLGRMMQLPYDSTDTWGPTWNNGEDVLFNGIFPSSATGGDGAGHPELQLEYRNVVREIRDLLFQEDQINAVIDSFATPLLPVAEADYARWKSAPAPASYDSLFIPSSPGVTGGLPAYAADMKNFMFEGGSHSWWIDRTFVGAGGWVTRLDTIAADNAIPNRPTITYAGTNGFPVDGLVFQSSPFSDPQGGSTFAAMQWRVAEINIPGNPPRRTPDLRLEWDAAWDSGEQLVFNSLAAVPVGLLRPESLYRARVRHQDDTGRWSHWSLPFEFIPRAADVFGDLRRDLVFAEVMYNPPDAGAMDGDEFEFVELRNQGDTTLNLTGLFFSDGIEFSFTNGTRFPPGETFLLARNPAVLATLHPGVTVHGVYTGKLDNGGETLTISHLVIGEIVSLAYEDRAPWPVTPDGFGFSLVRADDGTYRSSASPGGTPGADGGASPITGVVVNEALSNSSTPLTDTIELLNLGGAGQDISHWYLTDDAEFPWKYRIPMRPALGSGEFAVFNELDFNPTPGAGTSFSLSSFGEEAYVFSANAAGELTGYSHGFEFQGAQDGISFGRYVNSVGDENFPLQSALTFGAANAGPRVGPVVISEIHYHPRQGVDEFVELRNLSPSAIQLFDAAFPTNTWQINGLSFDFPMGVTLPAQGTLLLVSDNPASFRARFNIPLSVEILQFVGTLQDSGENLEIRAPDLPTPDGVPYYAVDTVRYNDRSPWPLAADGAGASLQRIDLGEYGNDPVNWLGAVPTPGAQGLSGTPPLVTGHPTARTNALGSSAIFEVAASGTGPLFYQWRFQGSNLDGATNATLPLTDLQFDDAGNYSVIVFNTAGAAESMSAQLTVRVPPAITVHPVGVSLYIQPDSQAAPMTNVTFTVSAVSFNPPLTFQWTKDGLDIPGATEASLTLSDVQVEDEGLYRVRVTDAVGSLLSEPAALTPLIRPTVIQGPLNQRVVPGEVVTVSAQAVANPLPLGWEWRRLVTTVASNALFNPRDFYTFTNQNSAGSVVQYFLFLRNEVGLVTQLFTVTTVADTDGDGLSDEFETQHDLDPNSPSDRDQDGDADGATNWEEYRAGTDPGDDQSFLLVEIEAGADGPTILFAAAANKTYTIEYQDGLGAPWQKLRDVAAPSSGQVIEIADPDWTDIRIYRAVTPRQPEP